MYAGHPTTTQLSGTSFVTTQFAPIITLFPTLIFPRMHAPHPNSTLSPIIGRPPRLHPKVALCLQVKFPQFLQHLKMFREDVLYSAHHLFLSHSYSGY